MSRKRLLWKVAPPYLAITLLAVLATGWFATHSLREFFLQHTRGDLELRARLVMRDLPPTFPATEADSLQRLCLTLRDISGSRITMIGPDGRVLGDSDADPRLMENHASHPEVHTALRGEPEFDVRFSATMRQNMMYFALPVRRGTEIVGVVRAALPLTSFDEALSDMIERIILGVIGVAVMAALITYLLSRRISRPIVALVDGARRYATGDFSHTLDLPDSAELASLAETLNHMARELDAKIRELTTQRNEQDAVLASMGEGVIAVGRDEHILFMNPAAEELLGADRERAKGRLLQEYVRSSELQQFIRRTLTEEEMPAPREISLPSRANHVLQVSGSLLRGPDGTQPGVLVVLNDITRLRQLEGLRREFVANVSHELKTPITTIKGFVETLREGALEDKDYARTFLERISRNVDRLNAIIDDLLNLSRIERDTGQSDVKTTPGSVADVVRSAVTACFPLAEERRIALRMGRCEELTAPINATLLEQAVVNLLDNAIKYSEEHQEVEVDLYRAGNSARIVVRDHGVGISAEHLPRLFERFYRVDKARSRKLGGTGLGLAIVKHIAQAHKGHVEVESTPGAGSMFTITLPME
ncbi:MAG TPA: ATP-binding protein [bacterium]|jgi:two-component system phosphate regulon sensor histidine kinase PhoR